MLARRAICDRLAESLPADVLGDVTLAVSELVANAVLHGTGDIELRVESDGQSVKGEVIDGGCGFERRMREDDSLDGVGGRGLFIVGQLAESWGVHEGTTHVWFEIPLGGVDPGIEQPELGPPGDDRLPDVD